jgi:hypothetical protein
MRLNTSQKQSQEMTMSNLPMEEDDYLKGFDSTSKPGIHYCVYRSGTDVDGALLVARTRTLAGARMLKEMHERHWPDVYVISEIVGNTCRYV